MIQTRVIVTIHGGFGDRMMRALAHRLGGRNFCVPKGFTLVRACDWPGGALPIDRKNAEEPRWS